MHVKQGRISISHGQVIVINSGHLAWFSWTKDHSRQGFARIESAVSFSTLIDAGTAELYVSLEQYHRTPSFRRVIAVPFQCESGNVNIYSPDDFEAPEQVEVPRGFYRLVAAQHLVAADHAPDEAIHLYFERCVALPPHSEIYVADAELDPPTPLLERCELLES